MDPNTRALIMGAAGAGGEKIYVEDVFSTWLYTGNGSTQTITNGIDLAGKGGLVWAKSRSNTFSHGLWDTARGSSSGNSRRLLTNSTTAATTSLEDWLTFNSNGFTANFDSSGQLFTSSGVTYTSWTFRKAAKFFDVVTYAGSNSVQAISHNLGSVPGFIIIKNITDGTVGWCCYHTSLGNAAHIILNQTNAANTSSAFWNSTSPTSTQFTVTGSSSGVNQSGSTYVAYLFAHDAGGFGDSGNDSVVKCGSFNTGVSGLSTVTLGWEPQWVLIKKTSSVAGNSSDNWFLLDTMRGLDLTNQRELYANTSSQEFSGSSVICSPLATGFTVSGNFSTDYIYIAIRRGPMKTPTDATKVFEAAAYTGTGSYPRTVGSLSVTDLAIGVPRTTTLNNYTWIDRLRGGEWFLSSDGTSSESQLTSWKLEQTGQIIGSIRNASSVTYIDWLFRRAPGFFDVVAYTGTGVARTVSHNLGVAPELMIVKRRDSAPAWNIYNSTIGATQRFNFDNAAASATTVWSNTAPTSSVFSVDASAQTNFSTGTYIAYLFASCPGVSKVGSYTGTGTTLSVDCGFTNGARFVLIKRTDSTGDWYVWDTARGIVAANDPYLLLNSTAAAEVTNTDFIDPLSSGFQISSTAPAAINANGGSFIYLAIA